MSPFTGMAPEIRTSVYNILLHDSLINDQRILYYGRNPLRGHHTSQTSGRLKRQYLLDAQDRIAFVPGSKARRVLHLDDIDNLLNLAATCHLLRSDILAMAWSNADIYVGSDTLFKDLTCVFKNRLSTECCAFIRTLRLDIGEEEWSLSQVNKTAGLITSCLPQLQSLFLATTHGSVVRERDRPSGLKALASLSPHVTVIFRYNLRPSIFEAMQRAGSVRAWADQENERSFTELLTLRTKSHRRRKMRAEKELRNEVGSFLQDTVVLRALT
ncbi:hypothetical protein E4T39_03473 [Aureobasidium subglaciale]|nr:hypothetical protein E4T39_03473 [Aureobasidium subglaciale]